MSAGGTTSIYIMSLTHSGMMPHVKILSLRSFLGSDLELLKYFSSAGFPHLVNKYIACVCKAEGAETRHGVPNGQGAVMCSRYASSRSCFQNVGVPFLQTVSQNNASVSEL
jgi:hypothetical protein